MFDIRQGVSDKHGEVDDERFQEYCEQLMDAFAESPEGRAIIERFGRVGWAYTMMDYAMGYLGVTPADMTVRDFNEIVFDAFPRKVSVEPECADEVIEELAAFWRFVGRQYKVPHAQEIVTSLGPDSADQLRQELADSSNFGMAKSMFMSGKQAGFDMTTQQGLDEFLLAYNAPILAKHAGHRLGGPHLTPQRSAEERSSLQQTRKRRRKQLKTAQRKRNRK